MTIRERLERLARTSPARWVGLAVVSWLLLRPALLVTISLDDLINPFDVLADYGASPFGMLAEINRDVLRNGHFNFLGQSVGGVVFRLYTQLASRGIRYSLLYALTKYLVFVLTAVVAARLLRTLAALAGRTIAVWRSRLVVALALFGTLQLHVAWSLDPVGSFPLSGYLSVVVGLWALDVACRATARGDGRSAALASAAICISILYYEINVAVIVALAPVVLLHLRDDGAQRRRILGRAALMTVPAVLMTLVLQAVAAAANRGYTGTDVGVGDDLPIVVVRTVGGSLPASAWGVARDWTDRPIGFSLASALSLTVVAVVVLVAVLRGGERAAVPDRRRLLLVVSSPVALWLAATLVQATTEKVRAETPRLGFVYNYYAYGSVGVVLAAILAVPLLPRADLWRRARPVLAVAAVVFVVVQGVVNDSVHREFGERLQANRDVLVAYTDELPMDERCAAITTWAALPFWQPYYRDALVIGMDTSYRHFHGEPFCDSLPATAP